MAVISALGLASGWEVCVREGLRASVRRPRCVARASPRGWPKGDERRSLGFALLTAITIALYTVVDGLGVRRSQAPFGYIAWLFAIDGLPIFLAVSLRRRGRVLIYFRSAWLTGLAGGLLSFAGYGIVIWALSRGAMAHVAALRETGVILAAAIGAFFLNEPFGPRRIVAAAIVVAGIAILETSR